DQALIARIQAIDSEALSSGRYPAANMIASLRHKGRATHTPIHEPVSAQQHVALTREQLAKTVAAPGERRPASG
ncbi:MAG: hypothetical protein ABI386_02870, partial [Rhodanobacter sp.]